MVSAIIIAQFAKVIVGDLATRINLAGTEAMKVNLKLKLGEKLLEQDLETFDEVRRVVVVVQEQDLVSKCTRCLTCWFLC